MAEIEINKIVPISVSSSFIKKVLTKALKFLKKDICLSVALVDEKTIQFLNKKYRGRNKITDVLAFNYSSGGLKPPEKDLVSGEIIICWSAVKNQAKIYKEALQKTLALLLVHGLLHILGYNHRTRKDKERMKKKTQRVLTKISDRF